VSIAVAARPRREAVRVARTTHPATVVLGIAIFLWIVVFGVLVWRRHALYGTIDFDLGIHDQSIWQLSRGHWFTTVRGLPIFGHHATFGYFLLVPFYWLGAGPQFINLFQVVVLALGAIPIYLLARDRLTSPWAALVPALVWLLQPAVQWFAWETFHPEVIAVVAVLCAYLAAERNRLGWYWVFLFLAIIWKEDLALLFIGLGLLYLLRRRWRLGGATIAVGAIWFAAFAMVMVPHLAGGKTVYGPLYGTLGDSPSEVARTAVTDPGAVASRLEQNGSGSYAVQLMAPMAFTPLAAPGLLLLGLPQAVVNLLSTANFTWDVRYHYAALPVVALALGMVEGIAFLDRRFRRRAGPRWVVLGVTLAFALFATHAWGPSPVSVRYHDGYWPDTRYDFGTAAKDRAVAAIPSGAAVSADYNLVPHLAHRPIIYTFPNPWTSVNYGTGNNTAHGNAADVEWIAVNTYVLDAPSQALLSDLIARGEFVVDFVDDGVTVAHRVKPPPG
jgi:uncharacterized membrane protein